MLRHTDIWLTAYVNETDLGRVKLNQPVDVKTDTYDDRTYRGRISFISQEAEFTPKQIQTTEERIKLVYRIKVDITNPNLELKPGKGGQVARSAGTMCQLLAKEGSFAHIKMPSGEVRLFKLECKATLGQVGNVDHESISLGKAGRSRWLGRRPRVRGVAMNPVDHPMGGGEGKSSGGRHPCSPWGQLAKGLRTRKRKKASDKLIVKRRT